MTSKKLFEDRELEETLKGYFASEFPRPFPKAPAVYLRPHQAYAFSARLALAASLLAIFSLAILWPGLRGANSSNGLQLDKVPSSASDAKRHRVPPVVPMGDIKPMPRSDAPR
ncbi:MAG: hypothetical protein EXR99_09065 [Gemmataceae bacterium]|nr:hypothetical protein [Gemmataceae bacterium]